jgi:hypothetical protein
MEILRYESRRGNPTQEKPLGKWHRWAYWRCQCGTEKWSKLSRLRSGKIKSCGCQSHPKVHGLSCTPEYRTWAHVVERCTNPSIRSWANYGGRGINICERWRDFRNFYEDMGPKPAPRLTIERIDNEGNYEPGNCRWATYDEQARNKRNTRYVTIGGERKLLVEVAKGLGLKYGVAAYRLGLTFRTPKKRSMMHLLDRVCVLPD